MKWEKTDLRVSHLSILDILALFLYMRPLGLCQILISSPFLQPIRINKKTGFKACGLKAKAIRFSDQLRRSECPMFKQGIVGLARRHPYQICYD